MGVGTLWPHGHTAVKVVKERILVLLMLLSVLSPLAQPTTALEEESSHSATIQAPLPTNEWGEELAGEDITHLGVDWTVQSTRSLREFDVLHLLDRGDTTHSDDYSDLDMVLDRFGGIHACVHNGTAGSLEYFHLNSTGIVVRTIVDDHATNVVGKSCDIELDARERARIAYLDVTTNELKFAIDTPHHYVDFQDWHVRTVTDFGTVSAPIDLVILSGDEDITGGAGTDFVLWIESGTNHLHASYYTSTYWEHESVIESAVEGFSARQEGKSVRILHEASGLIRAAEWPSMNMTNIDAGAYIGAPLDDGGQGDDIQTVYAGENETLIQFARSLSGRREGRITIDPVDTITDPDGTDTAPDLISGDFNCDGVTDIVVLTEDQIRIHHGRMSGLNSLPDSTITLTLGDHYADVADINTDGCDDLLLGNPGEDSAEIHIGTISGLQLFWNHTGNQDSGFGAKIVPIGDVQNDGYEDWAVLASQESGSGSSIGRIYIYHGDSLPPTSSALTLAGSGTNLQYGWAIEPLGDIDGDGFDDIAISSAGGLTDLTGYGRVDLHTGGATGHSTSPDSTWTRTLQGTFLGYSVEVIGDVNGDGFNDLGIGEPYVDSAGPSSVGALHVLFGSTSGFGSTYNQTISGPSSGSRLGVQMSAAGDVDRDGYDDVWAIRPGVGNGGDLALLWGSSTGLLSTPRLYEMGDLSDVVRVSDLDDDAQEEWVFVGDGDLPIHEHLDLEIASITGPFGQSQTFTSLDLVIDGSERSVIGVHTDSGFVILDRPDELFTSTGQWSQRIISDSEDAAIDVTESGRIVVVYECNQGTLCLGRDMGHIASVATIESTGDAGSSPQAIIGENGELRSSYMLGSSVIRFANGTNSGFQFSSGPSLGSLNGTPIVDLERNLMFWRDDTTLMVAQWNSSGWESTTLSPVGEANFSHFDVAGISSSNETLVTYVASDGLRTLRFNADNWTISNETVHNISEMDDYLHLHAFWTDSGESLLAVNASGFGKIIDFSNNSTVFEERFNWTYTGSSHNGSSITLDGTNLSSEYFHMSYGDPMISSLLCPISLSSMLDCSISSLSSSVESVALQSTSSVAEFGIRSDGSIETPYGLLSGLDLDSSAGLSVIERTGDRSGIVLFGKNTGAMDSIAIHLDIDTDRDFIPDIIDDLPAQGGQWSDYDGDGFGDNSIGPGMDDCMTDVGTSLYGDTGCGDVDNDLWSNFNDDCSNGGHSYYDRVGCSDADGDGWSNNGGDYSNGDIAPTNWFQARDADGDGIGDNHGPDCCGFDLADEFPDNPKQWVDADRDGVGDNSSDPDGDQCPGLFGLSIHDRAGCVDSDGDGYSDPTEATSTANDDAWTIEDGADLWPWGPTDTSPENTCGVLCHQQWADSDGDGYGDNSSIGAFLRDAFPTDGWQWSDTDNDGYGDNWDDPDLNATRAGGVGQWVPQANLSDDCPTVTGNSSLDRWGCLDTDGDGHSNLYSFDIDENTGLRVNERGDALPDNPAQWRDKDGDGFGDFPQEQGGDQCVGVPGVLNGIPGDGCPAPIDDADVDGVADESDICPGTASGAVVDQNGCADAQRDDDDDGVLNPADLCPGTTSGASVDSDGCSDVQKNADTDGDGVRDLDDLCAETSSSASDVDANGCAPSQRDTDGDNVTDDLDDCPNTTAGAAVDDVGCVLAGVDSDGDGIDDIEDAFPTEATQWTDVDGDGFGDNVEGVDADDCPSVSGESNEDRNGCPDGDGDGWSDPDSSNSVPPIGTADAFPTDSTQWRDRDSDGYGDEGDGNNPDQCPDLPGVEDGNSGTNITGGEGGLGCPYVDKTDTDGDGVYDTVDICPDSPSGVYVDQSNGCTNEQLEQTGTEGSGGIDPMMIGFGVGGVLGLLLVIMLVLRFFAGGDYEDDEDDDWYGDDDDDDDDDEPRGFSFGSKSTRAEKKSEPPRRGPSSPRPSPSPPSRSGPPSRSTGPPKRQAGPPSRTSGPPKRKTAPPSQTSRVARTPVKANIDEIPKVATPRIDPRKVTSSEAAPVRRVRRTAGVVSTTSGDSPPTTTKRAVKKAVRAVKETSEPSVPFDSLFDDPKSEQVLASIEMARSMIGEGKEDRDILRQLQRAGGWTAEQSRAILDTSR